jgi:hypothetical protein
MNRGFVIIAQNTSVADYVKCARVLAHSLKSVMPNESVAIITDDKVNDPIFDHVVPLPHGDLDGTEWKLANDWQVYDATPYEYTIKLASDLYVPSRIDHWWDILKDRDVNVCNTIRNYKNQIIDSKFYSNTNLKNGLVDTYNAVTYFRKSTLAVEFYSVVRDIFQNWTKYKELLKVNNDDRAITDIAYAIAAQTVGIENTTLPNFTDMSMIHMKQPVISTMGTLWFNELTSEILPYTLRVNSHSQHYPFHYHIKEYARVIWETLYE